MDILFGDDLDKIREYLMENPNALDEFEDGRHTPLMSAAAIGGCDILDYLISVSGDKLINNTWGFKTVLHYCCRKDDIDEIIIRKLVDAGASGAIKDPLGNTPLHTAAKYTTNPNIIYILLSISDPSMTNNFDQTPLMIGSAQNQNKSVIEALVNISNDINMQNVKGETALHFACKNNNYVAIETLLNLGGDLTITCGNDFIPYDFSDEKGDEIICNYINSNPNCTSRDKDILYDISCKTCYFGYFE